MKVSFEKTSDTGDGACEIPTTPGVTGNIGACCAVGTQSMPLEKYDAAPSFNDEDIGFDDIILPRINLVQKVGPLSNIFTPGEIVLKQSLVIHTPAQPEKKQPGNPPLIFTVLGFRKKQFVEKTVGGAMGNLFNTEEEVAAAGGVLNYKEAKATGKPLYQRLATALTLIQRPEHLADEGQVSFPHECEGKFYALALWGMKGTGYTHAAQHIFTEKKIGFLRKGYSVQAWFLTTKLTEFLGNFAHTPVIRPGPVNSEAFLSFARGIVGQ